MKATVEDITSVKKKLIVEIDSEDMAQKLNEAYRLLAKKAKVPGFRMGKTPRRILERYYGSGLMEDLYRDLISETLPTAVEENKIYPINAPAIEKEPFKTGGSFKYSAVMEVKPEFELKDYTGLEIEKEIVSLTDEDVERHIEDIRKGRGSLDSIEEDRGLQMGDFAVIDYEGFERNIPIEGLKAENFLLEIGSKNFHPKFEEALVGLKKNETADITVSFDEKHLHEKLAGKTVEFKVRVVDIKALVLPELNDEFVKDLGAEINDGVEGLRKQIKENLTERERQRVDRDMKTRLLRKISDSVEFELPESLVEAELRSAVENIKQNFIRSGSSLERAGISEKKIREDFRIASERRVKNLLILGEIAKQNGITVRDEELDEEFRRMALGIGQDLQVVRSYYEANEAVESIRDKLTEEKTLNYLVEGANIIEVEAEKIKSIEPEQAVSEEV
ncbi:MAG: trigger factor [Desulfatiglandales bacterium]